MKKTSKLKHLIGAIVGFNVVTPFSEVGEQEQYAIIKVTEVYRAKSNGEVYVRGINLKRQQNSVDLEYRQFQVKRIINRTLVIIADNEWSREDPHGLFLQRLGGKGVFKYCSKVSSKIKIKEGLKKLRVT